MPKMESNFLKSLGSSIYTPIIITAINRPVIQNAYGECMTDGTLILGQAHLIVKHTRFNRIYT